MATFSKPAKVPRWGTTSGNIVEPPEAKKDAGWLFQEIPPSSFENWRANTVEQWFDWVNERMRDGANNDIFELNFPGSGVTAFQIDQGTGLVNMPLTAQAGRFQLDSEFYLDLLTDPRINFDQFDYLEFDRTLSRLELFTVSNSRWYVDAVECFHEDRFTVFSSDQNLDGDTFDTRLNMDAGNDYFTYDRGTNTFEWVIAGLLEMDLDANGLFVFNDTDTGGNLRAGGGLVVGTLGTAADATDKLIQLDGDQFSIGFENGTSDPLIRFEDGGTLAFDAHIVWDDPLIEIWGGTNVPAMRIQQNDVEIDGDLFCNNGAHVGSQVNIGAFNPPFANFISFGDDGDFRIGVSGSGIFETPAIRLDDTPESITYDRDNDELIFTHGSVARMRMSIDASPGLIPATDNTGFIGTTSLAWAQIFGERVGVPGAGGVAADRQDPVNSRYERVPNNSIVASALGNSSGGLDGECHWNIASIIRSSAGVYSVTTSTSPTQVKGHAQVGASISTTSFVYTGTAFPSASVGATTTIRMYRSAVAGGAWSPNDIDYSFIRFG